MKAVKTWNSRFCWNIVSKNNRFEIDRSTYDWLTEGHGVKGDGRKNHKDEDNPESEVSRVSVMSLPSTIALTREYAGQPPRLFGILEWME